LANKNKDAVTKQKDFDRKKNEIMKKLEKGAEESNYHKTKNEDIFTDEDLNQGVKRYEDDEKIG
jgi:hypothetical protein